VKVNTDEFFVVIGDQFVDGFLELFRIKIVGKIFGSTFTIVLDTDSVEKLDKHFVVGLHQPKLVNVLSDFLGSAKSNVLCHPGNLLCSLFLLDENRSELSVCRQGSKAGAVNVALFVAEILKYGLGALRSHFLENLVGFHEKGRCGLGLPIRLRGIVAVLPGSATDNLCPENVAAWRSSSLAVSFSLMSRGYALFDLDHTILPFDTQALFCNYVLQREGWRRVYLIWFFLCLPFAALRLLNLRTMKRVFASYLVGMKRETLEKHVRDFLESDFQAALYPEVLAELERNREEGRILILNSASPEFYLAGISEKLGFDHFIGTDMKVEEKMPFLPKIDGPNNKHGEKITAMRERELIPDEADMLGNSWAYSDSSADIPLLSIAENGVMIHPGDRLATEGLEKGWRTMTPRRPYEGKWGGRWASALQAFGLYHLKTDA